MVKLFMDGGAFMWPILGLFIFGLMICLERIYTLSKSAFATKKFVPKVQKALEEDGVKAALEVCESTPGPVAEIFHAGLSRVKYGVASVEKAIENAANVEMAFLERGMVWLSTVIVIAPMLGFSGTVAGMVKAFQDIEAGMIIQFFFNLFTSRVDKIIIDMEESSINLIDTISYKDAE